MTWLALDTATSRASVAAGSSAADAVEESLEGARQHARSLIPMVTSVLARRGVRLTDLVGLLVADGPGSFVPQGARDVDGDRGRFLAMLGRVAAAFAKGLADTRTLQLRTAPSLLVRAAGAAGDQGGTVLVSADALRGDRYAAVYRFDGQRIETLVAPAVDGAGR